MQSVAIIIPIYKDKLTTFEAISLKQCFAILGNYQIIFICPKKMQFGTFHEKKKNDGEFIFLENKNFDSITTYNHMLLSIWFYKLFSNYKYILIHQLDSFVFKDELMYWVEKNYSYIGAPWIQANIGIEKLKVGNGGFSLRNIKDCISVLKSSKKIHSLKNYILRNKQSKKSLYWLRGIKHFIASDTFRTIHTNIFVNEDKIFGIAGYRLKFFKIPNEEIALKFSFEKQPKKLYKNNNYNLPFGCHAWWTYDLEFFKPFIKEFGHQLNSIK